MICPHCTIAFKEEWQHIATMSDVDGRWLVKHTTCPECKRATIMLINDVSNGYALQAGGKQTPTYTTVSTRMVRPKGTARRPLSAAIPNEFSSDYHEAVVVLPDSAKASAALSRRCLQRLLRERGGFQGRTLDAEIQAAIDSKTLPSYVADALDAVRVIGNFAAHPIKSTSSGEIIDVEPGEAEQQLDTIELLFDFYFVQPADAKKKARSDQREACRSGKAAAEMKHRNASRGPASRNVSRPSGHFARARSAPSSSCGRINSATSSG